MAPAAGNNPAPYFAASGLSALAFFPLWKAAAIGQSGYEVTGTSYFQRYWQAVKPPWRGGLVVVGGMTWARAAIFFGSDTGSQYMKSQGFGKAISTTLPSLLVSSFVQVTNQPFVRSSVMLQNPGEPLAKEAFPNFAMLRHLAKTKGVGSLWLGTNAGILKTAPKYMVAIVIKDTMGEYMAPADPNNKTAVMMRSAKIAVTAGVAGAVLTNPLDAVRNEMFKTEEGLIQACTRMTRETGLRWFVRGCEKNLVAVAAPIAGTIFLTDRFKALM
eukprot:TRINITY_DN2611_c0_g1_i1.p1 TRINITY_DN2611_c0_g1~~TRINITY_DN2611_c0_g1_i1.p1  ORF type:complete len:272 (+),score=54.07 TRINITY_DN2611_c0_g1_i1:59-874(+)